MNIINGGATIKVSAEKPATTHTRDRYLQYGTNIKKIKIT